MQGGVILLGTPHVRLVPQQGQLTLHCPLTGNFVTRATAVKLSVFRIRNLHNTYQFFGVYSNESCRSRGLQYHRHSLQSRSVFRGSLERWGRNRLGTALRHAHV